MEIGGVMERVQVRVLFNTSDMPGTRKLIGAISYTSRDHPCHCCNIQQKEIHLPSGYTPLKGRPKASASAILQAIFRYRDSTSNAERERLLHTYGYRYSEIMRLTGFEPAASSVIEPMHNSFLGITKDFVDILFNADVLMDEERTARFGDVFRDATYPGHLSRIPDQIREQIEDTGLKAKGASLKADQWKRVLQMLAVGLFIAWEDDLEEMREKVDLETWWEVVIALCTGMRILHAHNISYRDAVVGVEALAKAAKGLIKLGLALKPNWHVAMHYHQ